jgi:capsular polysaccharide biosynthesis protein
MILRRGVYWAQFAMAVLLPLWVLVSRGIIADGIGWQFVVYLVLCPMLFVALAALVGLTVARKRVRTTRATSWLDAAALLVVWAAVFTYGLFALPALAAVVVLSIVAGFWVAVWQLVTETRDRVKGYFEAGQVQQPRVIPDVIVVPRNPLSR